MRYFILSLLCLVPFVSTAQKKSEFLPKGHLFEPLLLDPIESQCYAMMGRGLNESFISSGVYAPFAIGLQKGLLRWESKKRRQKELSIDVASFTQFEIFYNKQEQKLKRHILNTDFKVSLNYQVKVNETQSFRLRFYHISSHLGDDFLIKNRYSNWYKDLVNYEQMDFTYSWQHPYWRYYVGGGTGIRPTFKQGEERKRLAFQAGVLLRKPIPNRKNTKWLLGMDVRSLQQNDFEPGIKIGAGVRVGEENRNPFNFLVEFYSGHLPYSTFEEQTVQWIGAGFYFNPF
ncbi:MAG: DUF1207 domain-containing protein [Spirosomataceae bacterium]